MAIQVTCPKCFKRFSVSDKFAGKSGPCPNCNEILRVPEANESVTIHAPDDGGPKDRSGQSVLKPIRRTETVVTRNGLILTVAALIAAAAVAIGLRLAFDDLPIWIRVIAALALAPPLIWAAYGFAGDSELQGYQGRELLNRVLAAATLISATWLIYAFVPRYLFDLETATQMSPIIFGITLVVMLAIATTVAALSFELEIVGGLIIAGLYLIGTLLWLTLAGATLTGDPSTGLGGGDVAPVTAPPVGIDDEADDALF